MPRALIPFAICYDFDGTLAPGNMQERDFIPAIGMNKRSFWTKAKALAQKHEADEILMYMRLMLTEAAAKEVEVRKENFVDFGRKLQLFDGVTDWFARINAYGKVGGFRVSHHVISSGIREMISGTTISKHFQNIYASSFLFDHHGVATWPALALNYTTKTQYLFRINKGVHDVFDHDKINEYVPPEKRAVPFSNIVFIGDGETDIPCFRLVKDQGGHSIAVFMPHSHKAKSRSKKLLADGRVNFIAPADYSVGKPIDLALKAIMEKVAAEHHLRNLKKVS
ncbi:MAG: haloacid dehalogenase-like hydrolase [Pseudorhodoplanes sp.]|nr:haloacid dehalogenase-like hydrolase [Pseudorhodoplanes sp.]